MTTSQEFNMLWEKGNYRAGSTAQRMVSFLTSVIPPGSVINDYGCGTGRADVELIRAGYTVNMVDFASSCLEDDARVLLGKGGTFLVSDLAELPKDFPHAEWGICINVLMTVDPKKLDVIMKEMRRTCDNLIIEAYTMPWRKFGKDWTLIKGDRPFWKAEMEKYWPLVESPEPPDPRHGRSVTIGRSRK